MDFILAKSRHKEGERREKKKKNSISQKELFANSSSTRCVPSPNRLSSGKKGVGRQAVITLQPTPKKKGKKGPCVKDMLNARRQEGNQQYLHFSCSGEKKKGKKTYPLSCCPWTPYPQQCSAAYNHMKRKKKKEKGRKNSTFAYKPPHPPGKGKKKGGNPEP